MARIRLLFILNGIAVAAFGPFAAVILESRGFETTQIGLLIAMTSVAAVLSITVWGHVGDVVLGRARTLRIAILGAAALLALFMLPFPLALVAALYVGYAAFNGAVGPLSDALAVNALRDPGRQYGKVRAFASASFTVAAVIFGLLYGRVGYWPSGLLFVVVAVAIAVNAGGLPDLGRATLSSSRRGGAVREVLSIQPALPRVLVAVGLAHVGVFAGFTFLSLRIVALGRRRARGRAVVGGRRGGRGGRDDRGQPPRAEDRAAGAVLRVVAAVHGGVPAVGGARVARRDHRLAADLGHRLRRAVDRERDGDPDAAAVEAPGLGPGADLDDHGRARRLHRQRRRRPRCTRARAPRCCSGSRRCSGSRGRSPAG